MEIYAPAGFKATWRKFLEMSKRDGQSASELVRIWVEGYVARKDPSNPQRPITAYSPGHPDEEAMRRTELVKMYREYSQLTAGEITYRRIVEDLKARGESPSRRVAIARSIAEALEKLGVRVMF